MRDGQWHSFGNFRSSAYSSGGRNSRGWTNANFRSRNGGRYDGAWHSFGPSGGTLSPNGTRFAGGAGAGGNARIEPTRPGIGLIGAHSGSSALGNSNLGGLRFGHSRSGFVLGNPRIGSTTSLFASSGFNGSRFGLHGGSSSTFFGGLGWHGNAFGPFRTGYRWGGYGGRGFSPGFGWGHRFGWGWGLGWGWGSGGWGYGWPFWGAYWWTPHWAYSCNPWWDDPFWYCAWPASSYYYYPGPGYYLYDDPPAYNPNSSYVFDSHDSGDYLTPVSHDDDLHLNIKNIKGGDRVDDSSQQDRQAPQPESAPTSPPPETVAESAPK